MQFRCERLYMNIRLVACYLIQKSQSSVLMALLIHRLCYQKKGVIHVIRKESVFSFETDYLIALRLMILIILLLSFLGDGKLLIEVIQQAISLYLISKIAFLAPIIVVLFIPTSWKVSIFEDFLGRIFRHSDSSVWPAIWWKCIFSGIWEIFRGTSHSLDIEMSCFREIMLPLKYVIRTIAVSEDLNLLFLGDWKMSFLGDWNISFSGNYNTSIFGRLKCVIFGRLKYVILGRLKCAFFGRSKWSIYRRLKYCFKLKLKYKFREIKMCI